MIHSFSLWVYYNLTALLWAQPLRFSSKPNRIHTCLHTCTQSPKRCLHEQPDPQPHVRAHTSNGLKRALPAVGGGGGTERHPNSAGFASIRTGKKGQGWMGGPAPKRPPAWASTPRTGPCRLIGQFSHSSCPRVAGWPSTLGPPSVDSPSGTFGHLRAEASAQARTRGAAGGRKRTNSEPPGRHGNPARAQAHRDAGQSAARERGGERETAGLAAGGGAGRARRRMCVAAHVTHVPRPTAAARPLAPARPPGG